ncbi:MULTISPECIES: hypothetical protein [unclassified Rhodococcus (in: high G+C Gram-positive bacteria)]|uniref:hypothetical protein n=1 Tax=Rhodococcus sp. SJ-3 TaxID=3454628 RepID=UPI003F79D50B
MTVTSLALLAVAAAAPALSLIPRLPVWIGAAVTAIALGSAALTAAATDPAQGFALGATLTLTTVVAITGGGPAVLVAFRIARRQPDAGPTPTPPPGPLRGGRVIGVLERGAVAASILAGWPEGIAIIMAVKGLARYPELREPQASEQFIIGTSTSVLWAAAACGVGHALIT